MKENRRRLKNRVYAQKHRENNLKKGSSLQEENIKLKQLIVQLDKETNEYKMEVERMEKELQILNSVQ